MQIESPSSVLRRTLSKQDPNTLGILFLQAEELESDSLMHLEGEWPQLLTLDLGINRIRCLDWLLGCCFASLVELNLKNNEIESIQALACMDMPTLRTLILKNNRILSVKPLRKLNAPSLTHLSLYTNQVHELGSLHECQLPQLSSLELDYTNNRPAGEDIRWVLKIQSPCLSSIKYLSARRLLPPNIPAQIGRKHTIN